VHLVDIAHEVGADSMEEDRLVADNQDGGVGDGVDIVAAPCLLNSLVNSALFDSSHALPATMPAATQSGMRPAGAAQQKRSAGPGSSPAGASICPLLVGVLGRKRVEGEVAGQHFTHLLLRRALCWRNARHRRNYSRSGRGNGSKSRWRLPSPEPLVGMKWLKTSFDAGRRADT